VCVFIKFIVEQDNRSEGCRFREQFRKVIMELLSSRDKTASFVNLFHVTLTFVMKILSCIIFLIIKILEILSRYVIHVRILIKPLLYVRHSSSDYRILFSERARTGATCEAIVIGIWRLDCCFSQFNSRCVKNIRQKYTFDTNIFSLYLLRENSTIDVSTDIV